MAEFPGASIAVITENTQGECCVIAIQRDDKPIAYAGWWELPGGTLEDGETPEIGSVRECLEEVNVEVGPDEIHGNDEHLIEDPVNTVLVVAFVSFKKVRRMQLGNEGQACRLFELHDFLNDANVIPEQKMRLQRYLHAMGNVALNEQLLHLQAIELGQKRMLLHDQLSGSPHPI